MVATVGMRMSFFCHAPEKARIIAETSLGDDIATLQPDQSTNPTRDYLRQVCHRDAGLWLSQLLISTALAPRLVASVSKTGNKKELAMDINDNELTLNQLKEINKKSAAASADFENRRKKEALDQATEIAKAAGFSSLEDMLAAQPSKRPQP